MDQSYQKVNSADRKPAIAYTEVAIIPTKSEQKLFAVKRLNTDEKIT